jgi:glycerophosphoryl diester phosphodiesterase
MAYFALPRPRVFGHRGAAGVAPENTLPSFGMAAALGADYLELDVHATGDGTIVVLHDETLDRTTNGSGAVRDRSWSEVAALDAGYRFSWDGGTFPYRGQGVQVPTLESVLSAFPGHRFNIEIKQREPPVVDDVVALLDRTGAAPRCLLAAADDAVMQAIRRAVGGRVATSMSVGDVASFIDRCGRGVWDDYRPPGQALQVPPRHEGIELVTRDTVAAAHRFGCEVHAWTINDVAEIERLLDLGVDGVMSDFPGLVRGAVARRRGGSSG